ncbi:predicted protein [Streptomyces sp. AA4]|nr:predicted protein [Streptomyces sp. AA4]
MRSAEGGQRIAVRRYKNSNSYVDTVMAWAVRCRGAAAELPGADAPIGASAGKPGESVPSAGPVSRCRTPRLRTARGPRTRQAAAHLSPESFPLSRRSRSRRPRRPARPAPRRPRPARRPRGAETPSPDEVPSTPEERRRGLRNHRRKKAAAAKRSPPTAEPAANAGQAPKRRRPVRRVLRRTVRGTSRSGPLPPRSPLPRSFPFRALTVLDGAGPRGIDPLALIFA